MSSPTTSSIDDTPKTSSTCRRPITLTAPKRAKIDKPTKSGNAKALEELREISKKLETPADDNEFDCFGKSIASQLKKLPEHLAFESMAHIQSYLVQKRLSCCNSNNQQSTVDYNEDNRPHSPANSSTIQYSTSSYGSPYSQDIFSPEAIVSIVEIQ